MARVYLNLSGTAVSDIRNSLSKNDILSSDYFYISQQQLSSVNPDRKYDSGTTVYQNQYKSTKITYSDLSSFLFKRFKEYANFGSMAWELSNDYSLADHAHDYSKVEITSNYNGSSNGGEVLSVVSFQINSDKKYVFWMPKPKEYHMPEPSIGQLKFLARDSIPNVDESSSDFDGWTWPDGRTVQNGGRFPRAANYFGSSSTAASFTLPDLRSFIKPASLDATDATLASITPRRDFLPLHNHTLASLTLQGSDEIQTTIGFKRSSKPGKGDNCHAAKTPKDWWYSTEVYFNASGLQLAGTVQNSGDSTTDTYPTHNLLPVMIYIGKPSS